jgi:hypothetical protein
MLRKGIFRPKRQRRNRQRKLNAAGINRLGTILFRARETLTRLLLEEHVCTGMMAKLGRAMLKTFWRLAVGFAAPCASGARDSEN